MSIAALIHAVLIFAAQSGLPQQEVEYVPPDGMAYLGNCTFSKAAVGGVVVWCPVDNKVIVMETP